MMNFQVGKQQIYPQPGMDERLEKHECDPHIHKRASKGLLIGFIM